MTDADVMPLLLEMIPEEPPLRNMQNFRDIRKPTTHHHDTLSQKTPADCASSIAPAFQKAGLLLGRSAGG
jgi:hypothetical protein